MAKAKKQAKKAAKPAKPVARKAAARSKKPAAKPKKGGALKAVQKAVKRAAKAVKTKVQSALKNAASAAPAAPQPGQGAVCHVEFYAPDLDAAKSFWEDLLGLNFHPMGPNEFYFHGKTGWGPGGCLIRGEPNCTSAPAIYWQVDDIGQALAKAVSLGATEVKAKTEIPGGHGFFAHLRTAEGNLFGVWCRT